MLDETKDPWTLVGKIGGVGGAAWALSKFLRYLAPTKKESIDAEAHFREALIERITKLEADIDAIRKDYEARLTTLRQELDGWRDECRKLASEAANFERFRLAPRLIPPGKPE